MSKRKPNKPLNDSMGLVQKCGLPQSSLSHKTSTYVGIFKKAVSTPRNMLAIYISGGNELCAVRTTRAHTLCILHVF